MGTQISQMEQQVISQLTTQLPRVKNNGILQVQQRTSMVSIRTNSLLNTLDNHSLAQPRMNFEQDQELSESLIIDASPTYISEQKKSILMSDSKLAEVLKNLSTLDQ